MKIKLIAQVIGSLFPIIFPKQEFKPKRALGAVLAIGISIGCVHFMGVENTEAVLEVAEEIIELSEE